jgi:D-alanyl-D-alanine carboxypeptidase
MLRGGAGFRSAYRWGALGFVALVGVTAVAGTADARSRHHLRHHRSQQAAKSYQPAYAAIVVDANSGKVMQAANADSPRHPASLTKMMTLYLLFERLEAGKIKLSTQMPVSAHAAAQAPSKLDLKPGQRIAVEDAIKSIVTKSANDVAVVVAEALGGSELEFARTMTAKARALGMMHTNYHNASGLPDNRQVTTARDQAILARALQDRFPKFFRYFSTRSFVYRGKAMRNHNHLLGHIAGVDGIKTGYIRESGFNIAIDVQRNHRHLVVVVFGGRTAGVRDARARSLIDSNIRVASAKRTAPLVVEGWQAKTKVAGAPPLPPPAPPTQGSTAPIKPNPVKTVLVQPATMHTASLAPPVPEKRALEPAPAAADRSAITTVATVKNAPLPPAKPGALAALTAKASAAPAVPTTTDVAAKTHAGWMIQVGAFEDEGEAKQRLAAAQVKAKDQLDKADSFTEPVTKGDKKLFRARFAGLDKTQAQAACNHLKHSDIPCFLLRN